MPQFDVASFSSQFIWLIIVFAFLYFLVSRFIAPKAESILSSRNSYIEENLHSATEYNDQVKSLDDLRRANLAEVNARVEDIQKQMIEALELRFHVQQTELFTTIQQRTERAAIEINEYVDKFYTDQPDSCISLAAFIVKKITNKSADLKHLRKIQENAK